MKFFRNKTGAEIVLRGRTIAADSFFEIPSTEYSVWASDDAVIDALSFPEDYTLSLDGSGDFSTSSAKNIHLLMNEVPTEVSTVAAPSFTAKTLNDKKIYARNSGTQHALSMGSNVFSITATLAWAKVTGVEVIGAETLDYVDFKVKDTPAGLYSGVPNYTLNQFGFSVNIAKDYYRREASFDADLYVGMVLEFTYNSTSAKTIGVNIIQVEVK